MRYYNIVISGGGGQPIVYTSHPNGTSQPPDPGALNVELDLLVYPFATPGGNSFIRIWGISLQTQAQASLLNGQNITVSGGMGKGLPLANPQQAGPLASGTVWQALANWQGVNMTLDLYMIPGQAPAQATANAAGNPDLPASIALNWQAQQPLSAAIKPCLQAAYPGYTINVSLNSNLTPAYANPHYCGSLVELAQWLLPVTQQMIGGSYPGVSITVTGTTINVFDNTNPPPAKMIMFNDLIGQVTWIAPQTVQAACVMRGDLKVGDVVTMPSGQIATQAQSYSQFRQSSAIKGTFTIVKVHHVGNFRDPMGASWTTIIDAVTGSQ